MNVMDAIRPAATVLLLRRDADGPRVLMGMRGAKAAFMPSKYVFPGGAVDADDADVPLGGPLPDICAGRLRAEGLEPAAIAAAALRELVEETGQIIGRPSACPASLPGFRDLGLAPDASALTYFFRAITPPGRPRRFDAHFFLADADRLNGDPDDFGTACDELSHLHWVALADARRLDLPFITEVVLAQLAALVRDLPADAPIPSPATVPFFDNRGPSPVFRQIA
ncbi:NUDIX hydrolase [Paracoccus sp. 1_MG-2023]|uniref:NUDIX hydrolase n=2 Tax=unclassified Paracoccus (in: a-proteobacteria) TaxID=2688777 RepID=UPI0026E29F9A|nr:NUDIX hydrolase [Paracoccus sp. 1_MG-2023]MDO6669201.1 NUDIX hydrolase [Paracoccus sp. 1_MG-2023]